MGRRWPWWIVKPRLAVVLGGGATLGAFEVGVIDVLARRGIVPDLLVGTSAGAINAAFWAHNQQPDAGERLLRFWLESGRPTMFPDGPFPMVGRLVQRKDHLTTQQGLARQLHRALPADGRIEDSPVPLALIAAEAKHGARVVLRHGPLIQAVLASSAIPGLWPPVEIDGHRLADGGPIANCDLQAAVELGMTDAILVDVMGNGLEREGLNVAEVLERAIGISLRRQTELAIMAFGRGTRTAMLRPNLTSRPRFGDFSRTPDLYKLGQQAAEAFLARHMGPRRSVRPGVLDFASPPAPQAIAAHAVTGTVAV